MAVVYRHRRLDTNEIFYIGIGVDKRRAYEKSKHKRSEFWHKVNNKTDIVVEILVENISYSDAEELEIFLISLYGRKDLGLGTLVNMTDGGGGTCGYNLTEHHKESLRNRMKSDSNPAKNMTDVHRENIKKGNKGKGKGRILTDETKLKISNNRKGKLLYGDHHQAKKVINTITGEVYDTIKEVAELLGMKYTTLRAQLSNQNKNKTNYKMLEKGGSY
jgi:hypothetical protein